MTYHQSPNTLPTSRIMNHESTRIPSVLPSFEQDRKPGLHETFVVPGRIESSPGHRHEHQDVSRMTEAPSSVAKREKNLAAVVDGNKNLHHDRPHLRLSHIERSGQANAEMAQHIPDKEAKDKYHESLQCTTGVQWSEQMSKTFARPDVPARHPAVRQDRPPRPHGLAATHPANYIPKGQRNMEPPVQPPLPPFKEFMDSLETTSRTKAPPPHPLSPTSSAPEAEPPWRIYTDPMKQTSQDPVFWDKNGTVLRSECYLKLGNVISPTWMVGLPFGTMTEMAAYYPPGIPKENPED